MRKGEDLEGYNWRNYKVKGWPYSSDAPQNKKWQHDRAKLFREGGNGWWRLKGTPEYSKHLERIKNEMP
jgi:hypothetical protein|tara:strand:- start:1 stop:207 length:207 start_codon:yes stop_codon:yes gene_type:complete